MAGDIDTKLVLQLTADIKSLQRSLKAANDDVKATTSGIEKNFGNVDKAVARTAQSIERSMSASTKNLTFQLQDVTQGLLSGQSPFTIMLQQASQAGVAIDDLRKSGGLLKGLGGAVAGLLSPGALGVSASILALGYLAKAAESYFSEAEEGGEAAAKALKEQRDMIASAAKEFGAAYPELKAWNDQIERLEQATKRRKAQEAASAEAQAEAQKMLAGYNEQMENAIALFNKTPAMKAKLAPVIEAWETLKRKVADQTATVADAERFFDLFNKTVAKLPSQKIRDFAAGVAGTNTLLKTTLELMSGIVQAADKLNLDSKAESLSSLREARIEGNIRDRDLLTGPAVPYLQSRAVGSKIREAVQKFDGDFADSLAELLKEFPSIRITSAFRSFEEQRRIYDSGVRPAAKPGRSLHEKGLAADLNFGGMSADEIRRAQARARDFGLNFPLPGSDAGHVQSMRPQMEESQKATDKATESLQRQRQQYDELLASISAKTDAASRENQVNSDLTKSADDRAAAIEKMRIVEELNLAAKQAGLVVDEALIQKHNQIAEAMVRTGVAAQGLAEQHKELARSREEDRRAAEQYAQQISQMAGQAVSGFIRDLRNGASAGEAFRNVLGRITDTLIEMAIQAAIVKPLFNFLSGGRGIVPGLGFPPAPTAHRGLHSGTRDMRNVSPAIFANAPRFHNGLQPDEFPAILQRGERIIPRSQVRRGNAGGTSIVNLGDVRVDVSTGMVTATNQDARDLGRQIDTAVQSVLVRESRPGGLLRQAGK